MSDLILLYVAFLEYEPRRASQQSSDIINQMEYFIEPYKMNVYYYKAIYYEYI